MPRKVVGEEEALDSLACIQIAKRELSGLKENRKETALKKLLDLNLNSGLPVSPDADTDKKIRSLDSYMKTLLVTAYPEYFFWINDDLMVHVKHPKNLFAGDIYKALGINPMHLSSTMDPEQFNVDALDTLYNASRDPLWRVLRSMKPITPSFSAQQKLESYIQVAAEFYDGYIGIDNKYLGALAAARAAYKVASSNPDIILDAITAFAPSKDGLPYNKKKGKEQRQKNYFGDWMVSKHDKATQDTIIEELSLINPITPPETHHPIVQELTDNKSLIEQWRTTQSQNLASQLNSFMAKAEQLLLVIQSKLDQTDFPQDQKEQLLARLLTTDTKEITLAHFEAAQKEGDSERMWDLIDKVESRLKKISQLEEDLLLNLLEVPDQLAEIENNLLYCAQVKKEKYPLRFLEEFFVNEVVFISNMRILKEVLVYCQKLLSVTQRAELAEYLSNIDKLLKAYSELNIIERIQDRNTTPHDLILTIGALFKDKGFMSYVDIITKLALAQEQVDRLFPSDNIPLVKNAERIILHRFNSALWIGSFTIRPVQHIPRYQLQCSTLIIKIDEARGPRAEKSVSKTVSGSVSPSIESSVSSTYSDESLEIIKDALSISKEIGSSTNKRRESVVKAASANKNIAKLKVPKMKQEFALKKILELNLNSSLQEQSTDHHDTYINTLLTEAYEDFFQSMSHKLKINAAEPLRSQIYTALGIDSEQVLFTIEPKQFNPSLMDVLYKQDKNPIWLVLKSVIPISTSFSARQKIDSYIDIAAAFYDGAIGINKKYIGALDMARAAYKIAGQYSSETTEGSALVKQALDAFSPSKPLNTSNLLEQRKKNQFGNWIVSKYSSTDQPAIIASLASVTPIKAVISANSISSPESDSAIAIPDDFFTPSPNDPVDTNAPNLFSNLLDYSAPILTDDPFAEDLGEPIHNQTEARCTEDLHSPFADLDDPFAEDLGGPIHNQTEGPFTEDLHNPFADLDNPFAEDQDLNDLPDDFFAETPKPSKSQHTLLTNDSTASDETITRQKKVATTESIRPRGGKEEQTINWESKNNAANILFKLSEFAVDDNLLKRFCLESLDKLRDDRQDISIEEIKQIAINSSKILKVVTASNSIVTMLRENARWYTRQYIYQASVIESAMKMIPCEQRLHLLDGESKTKSKNSDYPLISHFLDSLFIPFGFKHHEKDKITDSFHFFSPKQNDVRVKRVDEKTHESSLSVDKSR